jgi:hypothetical protein
LVNVLLSWLILLHINIINAMGKKKSVSSSTFYQEMKRQNFLTKSYLQQVYQISAQTCQILVILLLTFHVNFNTICQILLIIILIANTTTTKV